MNNSIYLLLFLLPAGVFSINSLIFHVFHISNCLSGILAYYLGSKLGIHWPLPNRPFFIQFYSLRTAFRHSILRTNPFSWVRLILSPPPKPSRNYGGIWDDISRDFWMVVPIINQNTISILIQLFGFSNILSTSTQYSEN